MIEFKARLEKFGSNKDKTGWTYVVIPSQKAQLLTSQKTTFRIKGSIDQHKIKQVAILPSGEGNFILAVNAGMRKFILKKPGEEVVLKIDIDHSELLPDQDFLDCLYELPRAVKTFEALPKSHQNYFTKWIQTAKTPDTKANKIAMAIDALSRGLRFNEMLREKKRL
ncbi:MAG: YdeI/OmpD-associated family protein [Saprospiraceae bacterium]